MRACILVLTFVGCVNARHAEVRLAHNPDGADCYSRCVASTQGEASVDCVAACPGAARDSGDCDGGVGCVEHRTMSKGKTALLVAGGLLLYFAATSSGGQ